MPNFGKMLHRQYTFLSMLCTALHYKSRIFLKLAFASITLLYFDTSHVWPIVAHKLCHAGDAVVAHRSPVSSLRLEFNFTPCSH